LKCWISCSSLDLEKPWLPLNIMLFVF